MVEDQHGGERQRRGEGDGQEEDSVHKLSGRAGHAELVEVPVSVEEAEGSLRGQSY